MTTHMREMSIPRKDDKRREEESPGVADIERGAPPTYGSGNTANQIEPSVESQTAQPPRRRILHRVPPQVQEKKNKHIYEPLVVSVGPYHHGKPHLSRYEKFKAEALEVILNLGGRGSAMDKGLRLRRKIMERVDEIRGFYERPSTKEYDDEALVEMMARDACMVLYHMETRVGNTEVIVGKPEVFVHAIRSIGALGVTLMADDFCRLENQIPWWIIKLLISILYYDEDEGRELVCQYLSFATFWEYNKLEGVPWEEGTNEEPLHLLEARRAAYLIKKKKKTDRDKCICVEGRCSFEFRWWRKGKSSKSSSTEHLKSPSRSATELKKKGIHFRPTSVFFDDIKFSSHSFYGVLHLPLLRVDRETTTFFSNIIVLEMSPGSESTTLFPVTSYINLMKSLIEKPKDAKLLQESGILISYLKDNDEIVSILDEIDTHDVNNFGIYKKIKKEINEHCDSKGKTWMAELIDTYFSSPWSAIGLLVATFLLGLTLFQAYDSLVLQRK